MISKICPLLCKFCLSSSITTIDLPFLFPLDQAKHFDNQRVIQMRIVRKKKKSPSNDPLMKIAMMTTLENVSVSDRRKKETPRQYIILNHVRQLTFLSLLCIVYVKRYSSVSVYSLLLRPFVRCIFVEPFVSIFKFKKMKIYSIECSDVTGRNSEERLFAGSVEV